MERSKVRLKSMKSKNSNLFEMLLRSERRIGRSIETKKYLFLFVIKKIKRKLIFKNIK